VLNVVSSSLAQPVYQEFASLRPATALDLCLIKYFLHESDNEAETRCMTIKMITRVIIRTLECDRSHTERDLARTAAQP